MQYLKQCATNIEFLQIKEQEIRRRLAEEQLQKVTEAARREEALSQQRKEQLIAGGRLKEGLKVSEYKFCDEPIYLLDGKGGRARTSTAMASHNSPAAQRQAAIVQSSLMQRRKILRSQQANRKHRSPYASQMSVSPVRADNNVMGSQGDNSPKYEFDRSVLDIMCAPPTHYQISELLAARGSQPDRFMIRANMQSMSEQPSHRSRKFGLPTQIGTEVVTQQMGTASEISRSPLMADASAQITNMDIWGDVIANNHGNGSSTELQSMSANHLLQSQALETNLAALNL